MRGSEDGSATLAVLGSTLVFLMLSGFVVYLGALHGQKVQTQAVADLSAIAGAEVSPSSLLAPGPAPIPCQTAALVAEANGAQMLDCEQVVGDLRVTVRSEVRPFSLLRLPGVSVEARARAGPERTFR